MDWSKKIGITFIIVLFLASCSNRKSYGSIYFSGGAELNDSTVKSDLSIHDYMSTSEISLDIHESVDKYSDEKTDSKTRRNSLNLPIDPQDSLQTISKIKEDSLVSFTTPDTIDSNREDSLNSMILPNKDLIEYSRDSVDHSDEDEQEMESRQISSQEKQLRRLKEKNDSINMINIKEADSSIISTQKEQIKALKTQNDSLNRVKLRINDSISNASKTIAVPVIVEEEQKKDSTRTIIKDEIEKGVLLKDSIVEEVDSIEVKSNLDDQEEAIEKEITVDSIVEVPQLDTVFYSVSFDSTSVALNEKARKNLDKLVKEAKVKNYALQLTGRTKSKTDEEEKTLTSNRVNATIIYLASKGLDKKNITTLPLNQEFKNSLINMNQGNVHLRLIVQE